MMTTSKRKHDPVSQNPMKTIEPFCGILERGSKILPKIMVVSIEDHFLGVAKTL